MIRLVIHRHRAGFTLIELLVVVGIVAVVLGLLLPVLARARRVAHQVSCASNMRQVGCALLAYATRHNGAWPAPALAWNFQFDEDWVHWQPTRDWRQGSIMPYLGYDAEVLKCPAGVPERGETVAHGGRRFAPYPFSYAVNVALTGDWTGPPPYRNPSRCRLHRVVGASHKVLLLEEQVTAINDGVWWGVLGTDYTTGQLTTTSALHDRGREYAYMEVGSRYVRGSVVFADGHWELLQRGREGTSYYGLPEREGNFTD